MTAAAAACGFVVFNKVFSPQYGAWLVALVPVSGAFACAGLVATLGLTHVIFDRFHRAQDLTWWVAARDAIVLLLYGFLLKRRTSRA
jgi:hypothetical protein